MNNKIYLNLASLGFIGYMPLCPGTFASIFAVIITLLFSNHWYFAVFTVIVAILAFLVSGKAERILQQKDASYIVIDDFLGMLITYLFIPHNFKFMIIGFFLFRMFDMLKVPPASSLEKLPGSLGIVGDDVIAGIYANIILQLNIIIFSFFGIR